MGGRISGTKTRGGGESVGDRLETLIPEGMSYSKFGGADGVRTHDLLDAIEARSQLRHGPTEGTF